MRTLFVIVLNAWLNYQYMLSNVNNGISNKTEKMESGTKTGTGLMTRTPGSTAMCIICLYFIFYEKYFILHVKVLKLVFFYVVKSK